MPFSRPMPSIGPHCRELRVRDAAHHWRIIYRLDSDAIVIVDVFPKASRRTPKQLIEICKRRLRAYDKARANPKK